MNRLQEHSQLIVFILIGIAVFCFSFVAAGGPSLVVGALVGEASWWPAYITFIGTGGIALAVVFLVKVILALLI